MFPIFSVSMSTWSLLMLPILHIAVTSFGVVRIVVLSSVQNSSVVLWSDVSDGCHYHG